MSRKDYKLIAHYLAQGFVELRDCGMVSGNHDSVYFDAIEQVARAFSEDNWRFDKERFYNTIRQEIGE